LTKYFAFMAGSVKSGLVSETALCRSKPRAVIATWHSLNTNQLEVLWRKMAIDGVDKVRVSA
jgi:hypothetical protein